MHDIAIPTKDLSSKFHDVRIKALGQICDISNTFQAILAQLTSNLFTSTVHAVVVIYPACKRLRKSL